MPPGKPLALGRTAEIYAWDEGQVLKLFYDWYPAAAVEREAHVARAVYASASHLPVPAVGDLIEVDGRLGLVFQRIEGRSMLDMFKEKPWALPKLARRLASLHARMHTRSAHDLPALHERLEARINSVEALSPELKEALVARLKSLPTGDRLCHGDFHPDNVLITAKGPVIIDWTDGAVGNPMADVARTSLLFSGSAVPPGTAAPARLLLQLGRRWFHRSYLHQYLRLRGGSREELLSCGLSSLPFGSRSA